MYSSLAVVLIVFQVLGAHAAFQYTDCTPASSPMHVTKIDVSPNPLVIPGDIHISFDGYNNGSVSHSKLHLVLKKKHFLFGADFTIPCISHVGSCDYPDICTILTDMDQQNWGFGVMRNLSREIKGMFAAQNISATHCPFAPGRIHVDDYAIHLPKMPSGLGLLSSLAAGDYYVEIKITDSATAAVVLCLHADIHVNAAGSSGFHLGKK